MVQVTIEGFNQEICGSFDSKIHEKSESNAENKRDHENNKIFANHQQNIIVLNTFM